MTNDPVNSSSCNGRITKELSVKYSQLSQFGQNDKSEKDLFLTIKTGITQRSNNIVKSDKICTQSTWSLREADSEILT